MMVQTSTPTGRMVSSVPLPPTPTLAELQSSSRTTAPASQGARLMSLNSSILAAQRDWEQKRQDSGHANGGGSSSYSDSPADSEDSEDDGSGSGEYIDEDQEIEKQSPGSRKRTLDDLASSSSPLPPTKWALHETRASSNPMSPGIRLAYSATVPQYQGQAYQMPQNQDRQGLDLGNHSRGPEAEPISATAAQATPDASTDATFTKSSVDPVYTEDDAIVKPKDVRPNYFSYPELHAIGTIVRTRGAIIPTGYSTEHFSADAPYYYKCPVVGCLSSFTNSPALGGHFSSAHKYNAYNDNCDGTLRRVGRFSKVTSDPAAAIVVSQIPKPPPDPTTLSVADRLAMDDEAQHRRGKIRSAAPEKKNTLPETLLEIRFRNGQSVRSYALTYLLSFYGGVNNFAGDLVYELSNFPKQRDFPAEWIECHQDSEIDEQLFTISLAYLVGREVRGPSACKRRERKGRLSDVCVALPDGLSDKNKIWLMIPAACVGCQYWSHLQRQNCPCDWIKSENRKDASLPTTSQQPQHVGPRPVPQPSAASSQSPQHLQIGDSNRTAHSRFETRRSSRVKRTTSYAELPPEAFTGDEPMQSVETPPPQPFNPKPAEAVDKYQNPDPTSTNDASSNQLAMETWERAPGRIVDDEHNENIAYSNAYLTSREPVEASQDVHFNVIVIKPGDKARWSAESKQLRTCSVAVGKVKVKLCNKVFHMGPNGMFVIRPGQQCTAENDLYVDSVMHCTTVKDYVLI